MCIDYRVQVCMYGSIHLPRGYDHKAIRQLAAVGNDAPLRKVASFAAQDELRKKRRKSEGTLVLKERKKGNGCVCRNEETGEKKLGGTRSFKERVRSDRHKHILRPPPRREFGFRLYRPAH